MTTVTDVTCGNVGVQDDDEDGGKTSGGRDSVGPGQTRAFAAKNSVVARLLLDNRPPSLQRPAYLSRAKRCNTSSDVRGLRSLPPPVDLSPGISVSAFVD